VRSLRGARFGWLDAELLRRGWLREVPAEATAVYAFLCLAADRDGVSFYRCSRIGEELGLDEQQVARSLARLRELDLVAYAPFRLGAPDGYHQVLSLPRRAGGDGTLQGLLARLQQGLEGGERQRAE
jgi:hypothetical protein